MSLLGDTVGTLLGIQAEGVCFGRLRCRSLEEVLLCINSTKDFSCEARRHWRLRTGEYDSRCFLLVPLTTRMAIRLASEIQEEREKNVYVGVRATSR